MLWRKSWMETRWRFLIGLLLLVCSAAVIVFARPQIVTISRIGAVQDSIDAYLTNSFYH